MECSDDELIVASAAFIVISGLAKKKWKRRRWWMIKLYRDRFLKRGPSFCHRLETCQCRM